MVRILLALSVLTSGASAIIIQSGDGNTSPPVSDPGWDYVLDSSVYIGNGWYLTANHTAPQGAIQLVTPDVTDATTGAPLAADLALFQGENLGLPDLKIAKTTPTPGTVVTLIGDGRDRLSELTRWDAHWIAEGEAGFTDPLYSGFVWDVTSTKRWGTNLVDAEPDAVHLNDTATFSLQTTFDDNGMTHEAQAATGDSGSAIFAQNGDEWELVGITFATNAFDGQPANSAVFGNMTFAADLAYYHNQIEYFTGQSWIDSASVPEPSSLILGLSFFSLLFLRATRGRQARD